MLDGAGTAARLTNEELLALIRAGEAAPELEPDRGEEVEQADVADEPAGQAASAAGGAGPLAWVVAEFRGWLEARNPGSSTAHTYPRAVGRFLQFVQRELGAAAASTDLPRLLALTGPYREALENKSFPAPSGEPLVARSSLRALERFAEAREAAQDS